MTSYDATYTIPVAFPKEAVNLGLGENLQTIDIKAFSGCTKISDITMPKTLTTINDSPAGRP